MKKILSIIGAISIAGSGGGTVIACNSNPNNGKTTSGDFNPFNLNSWGQHEKAVFEASYIKSVRIYLSRLGGTDKRTWNGWTGNPESNAVYVAGKLIIDEFNDSIDYQVYNHNHNNFTQNDDKTQLSKILQQGIYVYLQEKNHQVLFMEIPPFTLKPI